jgi:RND family efflux transporter MFP subunit
MKRRRPPKTLLLIGVLVLLAGVGVLLLHLRNDHRVQHQARANEERADKGPRVFVTKVVAVPPHRDVSLPAEVRAFFTSTVYAKIPGYLKEMRVDKGDRVQANQILAIIESPETDAQYLGAVSDLRRKGLLHTRLRQLLPGQYVSAQEVADARGAADLARSVRDHLKVLREYEVVRAPFTGLITGRYVDPGALIPAPISATESAMPLVDIADLSRVRIAVYVSQDVSDSVHAGTPVTITQDGRPDLQLSTTITRAAGAVDPRSRMMLCEVWIENEKLRLQAGTFARVTLHLETPPTPTVPDEAVFTRNGVQFVAIVEGNKVHLVQVKLGVDDGITVQVLEGLKAGDIVALNLRADIEDEGVIQAVPRKPRSDPAG